jgi:hypothetical protein
LPPVAVVVEVVEAVAAEAGQVVQQQEPAG